MIKSAGRVDVVDNMGYEAMNFHYKYVIPLSKQYMCFLGFMHFSHSVVKDYK